MSLILSIGGAKLPTFAVLNCAQLDPRFWQIGDGGPPGGGGPSYWQLASEILSPDPDPADRGAIPAIIPTRIPAKSGFPEFPKSRPIGVGELGLWVSGLCSRCPPIAQRACGHTAMAASWSARELRPPGRESMAGVLFGGRSHGPRECQRLSGSHSMGSQQLRPHSRHHLTEVIRHGCHRVAAEVSHTLEHKLLPLPFEPVAGRA